MDMLVSIEEDGLRLKPNPSHCLLSFLYLPGLGSKMGCVFYFLRHRVERYQPWNLPLSDAAPKPRWVYLFQLLCKSPNKLVEGGGGLDCPPLQSCIHLLLALREKHTPTHHWRTAQRRLENEISPQRVEHVCLDTMSVIVRRGYKAAANEKEEEDIGVWEERGGDFFVYRGHEYWSDIISMKSR